VCVSQGLFVSAVWNECELSSWCLSEVPRAADLMPENAKSAYS